jgi:hypothetical protein
MKITGHLTRTIFRRYNLFSENDILPLQHNS